MYFVVEQDVDQIGPRLTRAVPLEQLVAGCDEFICQGCALRPKRLEALPRVICMQAVAANKRHLVVRGMD